MRKLPPIHWTHNGRGLSVSLYVEADRVVGMTPVDGADPAARIQIAQPGDEKKYLGDHVAGGLDHLGVKKCNGCEKRRRMLNGAHKKVLNLFG